MDNTVDKTMSKAEFGQGMEAIASAYLEPRLLAESALNTWYRFFKDFRKEVFDIAVNEYILENIKRPSIKELMDKCKEVKVYWKPPIEERNAGLEKFDCDDIEAKKRHPFEEGWCVNDDGYWIQT